MPDSPSRGPTVPVSVRLEADLLREVHQVAARNEMTVSGAARHLLAIGVQQLQAAA